MKELWNSFLYEPLYNGLIFLTSVVPFGDAGIALVILTFGVKLALFPLSQKSIAAQIKLRALEGELAALKEKHKDNKEEQAKATMALYRRHNVNPFSGCLPLLIQLPIVIALYLVFYRGLTPTGGVLYSFIHYPEHLNTLFLGLIDISGKSLVLAIIAAVLQYVQTSLTLPSAKHKEGASSSFADEFSKSMNTQMRYVLPFFVAFIAYTTSGAVALYWAASSIFTIGQELYVRRRVRRTAAATSNQ
ncbi:YidC/Oxa1 family membrane protein insertase [Candidatus Parcubacteria bacterium]|nr:YidC/Oxa1 family membrane protein insertase [Candidatus Parcubacteria bacterium]